jgi:hypothetical protein
MILAILSFLPSRRFMLRANRYAAVLLSAAAPLVAHAQHATSPAASATAALGPADYAKWETLGNGALSPDGKWVAYDLRRGNGSTELRYRTVDNETDHTVRSATAPQFTTNGRWLLYTVLPDTAGAGARGGRGGRGGAAGGANATPAANRNKVGVVDLRSGVATTFDDIQSYQLSNDGSHVALRRYGTAGRRGADVIVRDLDAGTELTLGNVAEAVWNEDGGLLAMAIDVDGKTGNGVQLLDARTGAIRSLDAADAHYTGLQWRAKSDDLAAMRSKIDSAFIDTSYTVLAWRGAIPKNSVLPSSDH